ncbi:uncharacterized protein LOC126320475 [Schistocerca gregaria]|uniref:uncharacterized protein LOC126320475 n=1 Tax=Schistocerca gregaria TaxID=7010 RepID=UPI00211E26BC|nr:uncharacterized protein LOC126320475 [Schistocerca gregaria]
MAANVVDKKSIDNAKAKIFAGSKTRGFIILGYAPGSMTNIVLQTQMEDGTVENLVSKLDDSQVQYALIRIPDKKDLTDTVRDVMVAWAGPKVKAVEKSKKKTHTGYMKEVLAPFHADLEAISKANFTEAVLKDRSNPLSGSHVID